MVKKQPIKIAITALGGQGGGVLAEWIVKLGESAGFIAQSTSVPGVAQRTGATVYYVELFSRADAEAKGKPPILALMPVAGAVDIVLAAELMEAGRAVARGFVSQQTTLIASSHRIYAIAEKSAMGDGRQGIEDIVNAADKASGRCIWADMEAAAASAGAVISAVMFGALAGSAALPIAREEFERTIRASGKLVEGNLKGFAAGFEIARASTPQIDSQTAKRPLPRASPAVAWPAIAPVVKRMMDIFPAPVHFTLREGLKKTIDFQDARYGDLYLDRVQAMLDLDNAYGDGAQKWRLTISVAKHLALWMTYEDSIRVADLKTRTSRFERIRAEVRAADGQIIHVSEYLHPRVEEVCDILPSGMARTILKSKGLRTLSAAMIGGGRRISTTKLRGFVLLNMLASLRFMRRGSYRFKLEQARIGEWLSLIEETARHDYPLACAIAELQRLIKGYGDTHERGLGNYMAIIGALEAVKAQPDPALALLRLRDAALADEEGGALRTALQRLGPQAAAA